METLFNVENKPIIFSNMKLIPLADKLKDNIFSWGVLKCLLLI